MKCIFGLVTIAIVSAGIPFASATTIGVSFSRDGDLGVQSSALAAGDLAGAPGVRVGNWNNYYLQDPDGGTPGDGSLEPAGGVLGNDETVIFDDGSTVGGGFQVALTIRSGNIFDRINGSHINDVEMFNGVLDTFNTAPNSIAVSSVPFSTYDVYVYMFSDGPERAGSFAIGGTTYYARGGLPNPLNDGTGYILSSDTNPVGLGLGSINQGNYVKFTGLSGPSFTLDVLAIIPSGSSQTISRNKVAGFQIVGELIPEPATFGLCGIATILATVARRLRR